MSPKLAGDVFSDIMCDFMSSKPEFSSQNTEEQHSEGYISHEPQSLARVKRLKNKLRKKAFREGATPEDRKAFRDAIKTYSFLKRQQKRKETTKSAAHQEKEYHKNFWKFAAKCAKGQLDIPPIKPAFSLDYANEYYNNKYSNPTRVDFNKLFWFPHLPVGDQTLETTFDMSPIRPKDIKAVLSISKRCSTSAPGPDGIMYGHLKHLPACHLFLSTLFSKLLASGDPPTSWSSCNVSLLHKDGSPEAGENFRMICLTSCVSKIFHQILSERWANYMTCNGLIDPETQKAFLTGINGCVEHVQVMREIIAHARKNRRTVHITWFDLADAFGSVEHELIYYQMERNGFPPIITTYIKNLYSRLRGKVKGPGWETDPFTFGRGVFQGDNLSPIIFLTVFQPILQHLKGLEQQHGYCLNGQHYITLPFADDFCLITTNKRQHQKLITQISSNTKSMNLSLKPCKCKSMSIVSGKSTDISFTIAGDPDKTTKDAPEKFLGGYITFSSKTKETYSDILVKTVETTIENISKSAIRNEYKLRVYMEYAFPSWRYMLMVHDLTDTQLQKLDAIHTKAIKTWLKMQPSATNAILYNTRGLNYRTISDLYLEAHTLAYSRSTLIADNKVKHAV
ncbi:hypothetical protein Bbelb_111780 [Branchiostoma belcheri]|nr:hypothetical protein Bbelb_111780 [Branchiostoma belcheri]